MNRLSAILFFLLLSIVSNAQVVIPEGKLTRKGDVLLIQQEPLSAEQRSLLLQDINGHDYTEEWNSAMKVVKRGKIITYSGVGVFGVGSSLFAVGSYYGLMLGGVGFFTGLSEEGEELLINMVNMIIAGSVMSGVGILATIIGIGDTRVGYRKMDVVVEAYNNQKGYLAFGPTSNGIGLCYRF